MSRTTGFVVIAVCSAIVMGLIVNAPSVEARGNCQAKLAGHSYDCDFKDNMFAPFSFCFDFATGGTSPDFNLHYSGVDNGCVCDATGSASSPSFDNSSTKFGCVDTTGAFMINGTIKGKKLSIQGIGADGEESVGTCTLRNSPC
jgi:hypothetical protein